MGGKRIFFLFALAFLFSLPAQVSENHQEKSLKVMSFNIRCFTLLDGLDNWLFRKKEVVKLLKRYHPDLLGLQEVTPIQIKDLEQSLEEYRWFGLPRGDGKTRGERCPIFFKKERFELLTHQTFWLSETPEVAGSRSWGSACKRIVSWGKFRDRESGMVFYHFNTHFDHQSSLARRMSARLLLEKTREIAQNYPVIITGDFNARDTSEPYLIITSRFQDARKISLSPPRGPYGTSRSFIPYTPVGARIDYIFVSEQIKVLEYAVLDDTYGRNRRPSDHMPVLVKINWQEEKIEQKGD